ncbi:hypothetical protein GE061_003962 [Apolygus lucorum]|uniref:Sushi domain-containing protein n=1 Tax=Apolygus lucorum TaxID=248454 RepID=A0A8S9WXB2_APOLU|nr:hypothetical protein GE061_003962 [Apolygus lucorum]
MTRFGIGKWSGSIPACEPIHCPKIEPEDPRLILSPHNTTFGSRVFFSCPWGYRLTGVPGIECHLDSTWSAEIPVCTVPSELPAPLEIPRVFIVE